jgi:hypothetical protein
MVDFTFIDNIRVIFSILCDMIFFLQKFTKKSEKLVEFTQRGKKKNPHKFLNALLKKQQYLLSKNHCSLYNRNEW